MKMCLNPYFNGKYFLRLIAVGFIAATAIVLILILMENTFWATQDLHSVSTSRLNPYFNGKYFLSNYVSVSLSLDKS